VPDGQGEGVRCNIGSKVVFDSSHTLTAVRRPKRGESCVNINEID
jgi:hypothetical protein